MKTNEGKKIVVTLFVSILFSVILCGAFLKITGAENLVSYCVEFAIPSGDLKTKVRNITLSAKNAFSLGATAEKDKNENVPVVQINSLAYTPEDIKILIEEAEKNFDESEKGGTIVSQTYGEESATQKQGNVLVKNTTGRELDIGETLKLEPSLTKPQNGEITVLIFHTHTTETYQLADKTEYLKSFSPRSEDEKQNMIRVGEEIAQQLENAGIGVIHDTNIYDLQYSGAYERSGEAVDEYLRKYPSIQVVIDVHRDAIQTSETTKVKPVTTINGKKAAQIMIISGCEGNGVTDFPDWEYNLRFALRLQKTAEDMYPSLMRPLFFCNRRYNMYKSKCSVLLEMGSDANTLDEATYSGRLMGTVLAELINNQS